MRIPRGRALCLFTALLLQGCAGGPRATNALAEYLAPTDTIDADDPAVVARASALTSGLRTDPERVDAIVRFVREPARPEPCAAEIASRLLDCGRPGDTEQVVLLAALARAAGIPARLVVEQVTTAAPSGAASSHVRLAADLFVGKRWARAPLRPATDGQTVRPLSGAFADFDDGLRELIGGATPGEQASYLDELARWRESRSRSLEADDGWLTVAGLYWLRDGLQTMGSAPDNDLVLPHGAPPKAGTLRFADGVAHFEAGPGVTATLAGRSVTRAALASGGRSGPDRLGFGNVSLFVIKRGDRYAVRVRDVDSPRRKAFAGLTWFPADERLRVTARWEPSDPHKRIPILNVVGIVEDYESPGVAVFTIDGVEVRLEPVLAGTGGDLLFFIFKDATSGRETYPAGRFLYAQGPRGGTVVLDFNRAENPPCAYTPHATCPLPPPQNVLTVRIAAGEMYRGH